MTSRRYIERMAAKWDVDITSLRYERDAPLLFGDGGSGWRISTNIGDYFAVSAEYIVAWMEETLRETDALAERILAMPRSEVQAELAREGIDLTDAKAKLRGIVGGHM